MDPLDELRELAADTSPAPAEMASYLEKVRTGAYAITDADVDELKGAGISEDEIFAQTVAAAISEGIRRLDRAEAVIE